MCILIAKPGNKSIPKEYLQNGYYNNEDGGGFAVARNSKVEIFKGYFTFSDFYMDYMKETEEQRLPSLVHFRIGTSGSKNKENCHPFRTGNCALGHNGVIYGLGYSKIYSDTALFAQMVDANEKDCPGIIDDPGYRELILEMTKGNKICFLKPDGDFYILGESLGQWDSGIWYSNTGYMYSRYSRGFDDSYLYRSSWSVGTKTKRTFCQGDSCNHKLLKNPVEVEQGYCFHCFAKAIRETTPEPPFYEEAVSKWESKMTCPRQECDGMCEDCEKFANKPIEAEA